MRLSYTSPVCRLNPPSRRTGCRSRSTSRGSVAEAGGCDPRPSQRSCRRNPALNPKPRFKTSAQHGRRSNKSTRSSKRCTPWSSGASSKQRRAGSAGSRLLPRVGNFLKGASFAGSPATCVSCNGALHQEVAVNKASDFHARNAETEEQSDPHPCFFVTQLTHV